MYHEKREILIKQQRLEPSKSSVLDRNNCTSQNILSGRKREISSVCPESVSVSVSDNKPPKPSPPLYKRQRIDTNIDFNSKMMPPRYPSAAPPLPSLSPPTNKLRHAMQSTESNNLILQQILSSHLNVHMPANNNNINNVNHCNNNNNNSNPTTNVNSRTTKAMSDLQTWQKRLELTALFKQYQVCDPLHGRDQCGVASQMASLSSNANNRLSNTDDGRKMSGDISDANKTTNNHILQDVHNNTIQLHSLTASSTNSSITNETINSVNSTPPSSSSVVVQCIPQMPTKCQLQMGAAAQPMSMSNGLLNVPPILPSETNCNKTVICDHSNDSNFGKQSTNNPNNNNNLNNITITHTHSRSADREVKRASCHQCKTKKESNILFFCTKRRFCANIATKTKRCRKKYCKACMAKYYDADNVSRLMEIKDADAWSWICPSCHELCTCKACKRKKINLSQEANVNNCNKQLTPNASIIPNNNNNIIIPNRNPNPNTLRNNNNNVVITNNGQHQQHHQHLPAIHPPHLQQQNRGIVSAPSTNRMLYHHQTSIPVQTVNPYMYSAMPSISMVSNANAMIGNAAVQPTTQVVHQNFNNCNTVFNTNNNTNNNLININGNNNTTTAAANPMINGNTNISLSVNQAQLLLLQLLQMVQNQ